MLIIYFWMAWLRQIDTSAEYKFSPLVTGRDCRSSTFAAGAQATWDLRREGL